LVYAGEITMSRTLMKKILREPLLHFLLLGIAIFAAYSLVSRRGSQEPGKIVISEGQIAAMARASLARGGVRPPRRRWKD
jgi:hypothetical protein